ncbi:Secondary metabolism regulator LAE1 [Colletotrichum trifolii]|uniref:Secondary metabolism regulator LAE1 n=1 Tax=Colletotrichum trifolii TaxID=5466 RepID=A0A4R8RG02_COLTR|nr:Secondary metabolism regulator LAE1 [Colletotrichum trifolii]
MPYPPDFFAPITPASEPYIEYDRVFCGFRGARYLLPIDDAEQERLDIFHRLIVLARGEKTHDSAIPPGAQILDLGTGTGIWAIDIADQLHGRDRDAGQSIIGLDLALYQPESIPKYVRFQQADVEEQWTPQLHPMDMVHIQMMLGCIGDWPELYRKSFRQLKPGGVIEHVEIEWVPRSDDNTLAPDSDLVRWGHTLSRAMQRYRQPVDVFDAAATLRSIGFSDVTEQTIKLPINPWSTNESEALIGRWFNLGLTHGLEALTLGPFTRIEGWDKPTIDKLVETLKKDICMLSVHAYCRM